MRRWLIGLSVGLLVGLAGLMLGVLPPGAALEQGVGLTWLYQLRGPVKPPEGVVVVAMDGRTGDEFGLPALPRDGPAPSMASWWTPWWGEAPR